MLSNVVPFERQEKTNALPFQFKLRNKQEEIIAFLLENKNAHCAIQAPTGVGKTLAYLTYAAHHWKGRIIVSSFTKALQDQILREANQYLPELNPLVVKGRKNYICRDKLLLLSPEEAELLTTTKPPTSTLKKVTVTSGYCRPEYNCPFKAECEYKKMIARMENQRVLIINHYLIKNMSRFAEDALLIIDEAHHLEHALKSQIQISEEHLKPTQEPNPADYKSIREFNAAIEKFLEWKRMQDFIGSNNITSPGVYEVQNSIDFSLFKRVVFVSATLPDLNKLPLPAQSSLFLSGGLSWEGAKIKVENINYKAPLYTAHLFKQINYALKNYSKVVILATSFEQLRLIKSKFPQIDSQLDIKPFELSKRLREGRTNAIAGCDSLWTGIDIPGRKCIIMVKLPFPFTNDKNNQKEYTNSVETMSVKFRQGVGRLIRTKNCSGEIIVLDNRLKNYPALVEFLQTLEAQGAKISLP